VWIEGNTLDIEPQLDSPEQLEQEYRRHPEAFVRALGDLGPSHADNLLVRAWRARLLDAVPELEAVTSGVVKWPLVAWLAVAAGVCARLLSLGSDSSRFERIVRYGAFVVLAPIGVLLWSSLGRRASRRDLVFAVTALLAVPFAAWMPLGDSDSGALALAHLPVLLGVLIFGSFACDPARELSQRAEFVSVAAEIAIIGLALLFAGALLTGLTIGAFSLIEINIKTFYFANIVPACVAAVPVIATGIERARAQRGDRLGPSLARVFSPLVLATLMAYLAAVIGTQKNPYSDRESLGLLYAMLLAIAVLVTLMVIDTRRDGPSPRLAALGCAICGLSVAIDAIALSAIVYRLSSFGFTPNRIAVLGGNLLLFGYLGGLTVALGRAAGQRRDPLAAMRWIGAFPPLFGVWSALWVFALPALFGFD
jgi:hypothetical protein